MTRNPTLSLAKTYERSRAPLYVQIAAALRQRIEDGRWPPGGKISTLEELEAEYQVARVTVRQAVDILEKEGLVRRQQGRGTFVTGIPPDRRWLRLATDWDTLIDSIKDNVPHVIPNEGPPPGPRIDPGDGVAAKEYVFIKSVQSRDNEPYAFARVHVAEDVFELAPKRFRTETALSVLSTLEDVSTARAHQTLIIGAADMETAQLLGLALNAPMAEAHCVVVDDHGVAIYVADIVYRGDCVRFDIDLLNARTR